MSKMLHLTMIPVRAAAIVLALTVALAASDASAYFFFNYGSDLESEVSLQFSGSMDRSNPEELDGAVFNDDGEVAIFLTDLSRYDYLPVRYVRFSVNGIRVKSEYRPPYDLGGTNRNGGSTLINTSAFALGANEVEAMVKLRNGSSFTVPADFTLLPAGDTIVDVAADNPDFSILVEAVVAAGLVETLSGPGPFTVFAPTNQAFLDLLDVLGITKEELLADTELLDTVLKYHVLGEVALAADVLASDTLTPLQGEPITVDAEAVKVNDSNIIGTDFLASNGVIHVIDAVLLPPSISAPKPTIAEIAASDPENFSILLDAAVAVGLDGLLSVNGPQLTVFAPTNEAFLNLIDALETTPEELLANKPLLLTVLLYHVINEELFAEDVLAVEQLWPNSGEPIAVDAENGKVNDSLIIIPDVDASNGVVHVIDAVLVPPAALELLMNP